MSGWISVRLHGFLVDAHERTSEWARKKIPFLPGRSSSGHACLPQLRGRGRLRLPLHVPPTCALRARVEISCMAREGEKWRLRSRVIARRQKKHLLKRHGRKMIQTRTDHDRLRRALTFLQALARQSRRNFFSIEASEVTLSGRRLSYSINFHLRVERA